VSHQNEYYGLNKGRQTSVASNLGLLRPMPTAYAILGAMTDTARRVRLFRNGRNQAVRIPREMELRGNEATIRKEGDRLIIEPVEPSSLLALLATLEPLDEDIGPIDDLPLDPVDL
jgi:antitoxin VapB